MPAIQFKSSAKPSTYGYPAPLEEKKKEDKALNKQQQTSSRANQSEAQKEEDDANELDGARGDADNKVEQLTSSSSSNLENIR